MLKIEKVSDLSRVASQRRPECEHHFHLWNSYGCKEYGWMKNGQLEKNQNCSQIFNSYMECVISHSHK